LPPLKGKKREKGKRNETESKEASVGWTDCGLGEEPAKAE